MTKITTTLEIICHTNDDEPISLSVPRKGKKVTVDFFTGATADYQRPLQALAISQGQTPDVTTSNFSSKPPSTNGQVSGLRLKRKSWTNVTLFLAPNWATHPTVAPNKKFFFSIQDKPRRIACAPGNRVR